ncbi:MAG: LysR family transcriptional regulator [Pseudomonadota bacterium]
MQLYPARMQIKNWNDLRYLLALKRGHTISGAARLLGVDDTTVSRRLAALQGITDIPLYVRRADGSHMLSSKGEELARNIEVMEHQTDLIEESLGSHAQSCAGTVRLTSVPLIINRILAPGAGTLMAQHPDLELELVPDSSNLNLTRREADLAIRLARPTTGGSKVKARRIGYLDYAIYSAKAHSASNAVDLPWLTYEDAMAHILQAKWVTNAAKASGQEISGLKAHDGETIVEAILAGHGKSLVPVVVAEQLSELQQLENETSMPLPSREIWLLAHADQVNLLRIKTVTAWIEEQIT